jgi:acyl-CoA ligase (AMP-forming) (exosortase A-associated)
MSEKVAIVDGQLRITYHELLERSYSMASLFKETGITKGDLVAIYLRRSLESVIALFATYLAGGVAVVISEVLRPRQINYILEHSGASLLVTDSRQRHYLPTPAIEEQRIIHIDEVHPSGRLFSPDTIIGPDLANIIYTSGSTGLPKGIMLSHDNLLSGAKIVSDYLKLTEQDRIISLLPFSFDYGLNQLLTALFVGGTLIIQRSLFPADICSSLQKEYVTGMAGVPMLWLQLIKSHSPFTRTTFTNLRYITNSGGRLPEEAVRLIRKSHPCVQIYLMYGLTEAFRSTYLPPDQVDAHPSSIGKAIPNVEILVMHEEGRLCREGEVGELVHRGANISMGYWRDPESTERIFRPNPFQKTGQGYKETVVFSGDLVKADQEGYLYFVGRKDQLIKSHGFRVSPEEIEAWIFSSSLVSSVVAFAVHRDEVDSDIVAAVIPQEPATFKEEHLYEFCKLEMPEYMRPNIILCLDQFPQTSSGKPDRCKIKETYLLGLAPPASFGGGRVPTQKEMCSDAPTPRPGQVSGSLS